MKTTIELARDPIHNQWYAFDGKDNIWNSHKTYWLCGEVLDQWYDVDKAKVIRVTLSIKDLGNSYKLKTHEIHSGVWVQDPKSRKWLEYATYYAFEDAVDELMKEMSYKGHVYGRIDILEEE